MKILGIDYGRRKIGLAIAESGLAQPLRVISVNSLEDAVNKVRVEIERERIEEVVVGISEGEMAEESKQFALQVQPFVQLPIRFYDETLTSQDAQRLSREAGISQKRRHGMEDAFAASIMLQNFLDFRG